MRPVDPEDYRRYVEQYQQLILAGHRPFDSSISGNPVKLSDWIRVRKLVETGVDLQRVLLHFAIDPAIWREADNSWPSIVRWTMDMDALYKFLLERIEVGYDAAAIAATPPSTTRGLLEPGGTVVALGTRQILIAGHTLRNGKAYLRTCDLLGRKVVWESSSALPAWTEQPSPRSFRVHGARLFLAHERRLVSMTLLDGKDPWTVELPGSEAFPHYTEDLRFFHIPLGDAPGVIAIEVELPSRAHTLLAFDENSGVLLWQVELSEHSTRIHVIPGLGLVIHTQRKECWAAVYDARRGSVLASFGAHGGQGSGWVQRVDLLETALLVYVAQTPEFPAPSVMLLLVDPRTGHLFEMVQHSIHRNHDRLVVVDHRPLWLRWDEKAKGLYWLEQYPQAQTRPPGDRWERWAGIDQVAEEASNPAHIVVTGEAIVIAYNAIFRSPGDSRQRTVLSFRDRRTLAATREIRLEGAVDLLTQEGETLAARGNLLAFKSSELSVLDIRTGEILWAIPVPSWRSHRFLGAWLLVTTRTGWMVIHPETGTVVATWPLDP